jgi:hypothetical protein
MYEALELRRVAADVRHGPTMISVLGAIFRPRHPTAKAYLCLRIKKSWLAPDCELSSRTFGLGRCQLHDTVAIMNQLIQPSSTQSAHNDIYLLGLDELVNDDLAPFVDL